MIRVIVLSLFLSAISGCAPKQLYSGDRRSADQVAVIVQDTGSHITIDGYRLGVFESEAEVLPGKMSVTCSAAIKGDPWGCRPFTEHDEYAETQCIKERNKEIEKSGFSNKSCTYCEFEIYKQRCTVPQYSVQCAHVVEVVAGKRYLVGCRGTKTYLRSDQGSYEGALYIHNAEVAPCAVTGPVDIEEEMTCGSGCWFVAGGSCH